MGCKYDLKLACHSVMQHLALICVAIISHCHAVQGLVRLYGDADICAGLGACCAMQIG